MEKMKSLIQIEVKKPVAEVSQRERKSGISRNLVEKANCDVLVTSYHAGTDNSMNAFLSFE